MLKRSALSVAIFLALVLSANAAGKKDIEKVVKKAREQQGKVVLVSPKGGNGTLTLEDAVKELRPGAILRLAPGNYQTKKKVTWSKQVEIETDGIIVEGDGTGRKCNVTLVLLGRDCIVRNIWVSAIEAEAVTIVDTRTAATVCSSKSHSTSRIYNCYLDSLSLYPNNSTINVENCTLTRKFSGPKKTQATWRVSGGSARTVGHYGPIIQLGQLEKKGTIAFTKCNFQTNGYLFSNANRINLLSMAFDGNNVLAEQGMFQSKKDLKSLKDIKGVCRVRFGVKNTEEKVVGKEVDQGCYVKGKNNIPVPRPTES